MSEPLLGATTAAHELRIGIRKFIEHCESSPLLQGLVIVDGIALWKLSVIESSRAHFLSLYPPRHRGPAVKARTGRRDQPVIRVRSAVVRLSRDKWLAPCEVERLAMAFARNASIGNPFVVAKHAFDTVVAQVGLLRGVPPAYPGDPRWRRYSDALRHRKMKRDLSNELLLLKLEGDFK